MCDVTKEEPGITQKDHHGEDLSLVCDLSMRLPSWVSYHNNTQKTKTIISCCHDNPQFSS